MGEGCRSGRRCSGSAERSRGRCRLAGIRLDPVGQDEETQTPADCFAALRLRRLRADRQHLKGKAGAEGEDPRGDAARDPAGHPGDPGTAGAVPLRVRPGTWGGGRRADAPEAPVSGGGRSSGLRVIRPGRQVGVGAGDDRSRRGPRPQRLPRIARIAGLPRPRRPGGADPQRRTTADLRQPTRVRCASSPARSGKDDGEERWRGTTAGDEGRKRKTRGGIRGREARVPPPPAFLPPLPDEGGAVRVASSPLFPSPGSGSRRPKPVPDSGLNLLFLIPLSASRFLGTVGRLPGSSPA